MGDARVGFALTGSFCTLEKAIRAMEETAREYPNMVPILSETTGATDTRFGRAADFRQAAEEICGHGAVESVREAEPIGPKQLLDVLVIAPCTGNTLAKLANGHCRYLSDHGGQGAPAERPACGGGGVHQRRAGRGGPKHRGTPVPEALLFCPLPPG